jgi:hypothetical protein
MDSQEPTADAPVKAPPAMDVVAAPPAAPQAETAPPEAAAKHSDKHPPLKAGATPPKSGSGNTGLAIAIVAALVVVAALAGLATFAYLNQ